MKKTKRKPSIPAAVGFSYGRVADLLEEAADALEELQESLLNADSIQG